jgi:DNA-binding CsgD family transcriptional regulator
MQQQLNHNIIKCIPEILFTVSLKPEDGFLSGCIEQCSEPAMQLIGFKESEMKRKGFQFFRQIMHPDDLRFYEEAARTLLKRKKKQYEAVYRVLPKNAEQYIFLKGHCRLLELDSHCKTAYFVNTMKIIPDTNDVGYSRETEIINPRNQLLIKKRLTTSNMRYAKLLVAGKSNKESAVLLFMTESAAKWQRAEIKRKLNISNTALLIQFLRDGGVS